MTKGDIFPIARECRYVLSHLDNPRELYAQFTGETRPPRKGEWYLSGAIVEAYLASSNLDQRYPIAKLVRIREV